MAQGDELNTRGGIFAAGEGMAQFYDLVIFRRFDIFDVESLKFENRETFRAYEVVKVKFDRRQALEVRPFVPRRNTRH